MTVKSKGELQNRLAQLLNDPDVEGNVSWLKALKIMQFFDALEVVLILPISPVHVGMELGFNNQIVAMWHSTDKGWCTVDNFDSFRHQKHTAYLSGLKDLDGHTHPWPNKRR